MRTMNRGLRKYQEIEKPLLDWIYAQRTANKEINNHIMLQAAKKMTQKLETWNR